MRDPVVVVGVVNDEAGRSAHGSVAACRGSGTAQAAAGVGGDACARRAPGAGNRRGVGRRATGVLEVSELEEDVLEVGRLLLRGASRLGRM